jgi:hypothetical protein
MTAFIAHPRCGIFVSSRHSKQERAGGLCLAPGRESPMRSTVSIAHSLAVAAILAACASTVEEQAKHVVDDAHITERVRAALALEPALKDATLVNVDTYLGVVSLAGFVDSPEDVRRAAEVAGTVEGVQSVRNNIGVRSGASVAAQPASPRP